MKRKMRKEESYKNSWSKDKHHFPCGAIGKIRNSKHVDSIFHDALTKERKQNKTILKSYWEKLH